MLGPVETVEEIDSTNAELLRRARDGAPAGAVLVARHQHAGRGRLDRRWEAPPGASLLVSVLLRPALPPDRLHLLTIAAGLAAVEACRDVAGVELSLKWPNDVVLDTPDGARKAAGLLAESVLEGDRVAAVVVGMGLNVAWDAPVPDGGVALAELAGRSVDGDALLQRWLKGFDALLALVPDDASEVLRRYRTTCSTLGRPVAVETAAGRWSGVAHDVTDEGHLVVSAGDERRVLSVADVVHLRPV